MVPNTTTGTITIFLTAQGWMIDMAETSEAREVFDLFDSHVLPLPFTPRASSEVVMSDMTARNPQCTIVLGGAR